MQTRVIILLIFALFVAIFAVMNIQSVVIDFFISQAEIPLIFVIIVSVLIGALFMFVLSSMKQIQLKKKLKFLENKNIQIKNELDSIKEQNVQPEITKEDEVEKINSDDKVKE